MNSSEEILVQTLLQESVKNKKIPNDEYKIFKLTGDASTRRYYRVISTNNSYVICLDKPLDPGQRSFFEQVQLVLNDSKIRVPKIFDSSPGKGYSLQEDLGADTLLSQLATIDSLDVELGWYLQLSDLMCDLAKVAPEKYKGTCIDSYCFDCEKFDWEIKFSIDNLLIKLMSFSKDDKRLPKIQSGFHKLNEELASEKMVLCHRDLHSRNIMKIKNEFVLIDFQDSRPGNHAYDVVSLFEDCYYDLNEANKAKLKNSVFTWQKDLGLVTSRDHFEKNYSMMTLQRTFKALGSFGYIYVNRKDERYLKYIHAGIERIKKHLYALELTDLRKNLISILYEH
ncbi:MAG: phosphotransferase [Bdellovibrio sp.]